MGNETAVESIERDNDSECSASQLPVCGLIMPISGMLDCPSEHWSDVFSILSSAISGEGFECRMVSDSDDVGMIHDRIVRNIYSNPIAVCDVSCKNPNVMFELGMRLAFDKAVVIVKDDKTDYSFDTGIIEHIEYPRDLRHGKIETFKRRLSDKLQKTYEASKEEGYSPFAKHFPDVKIAKIATTELDESGYVVKMIEDLRKDFSEFRRRMQHSANATIGKSNTNEWDKQSAVAYIKQRADAVMRHNPNAVDIDSFLAMLPDHIKEKISPDEAWDIVKPILAPVPF